MKIRSLEEFDEIICGQMRRAMQENVTKMRAHGMSDAAISDAMPVLCAACNQARAQLLDEIEEAICDETQTQTPLINTMH